MLGQVLQEQCTLLNNEFRQSLISCHFLLMTELKFFLKPKENSISIYKNQNLLEQMKEFLRKQNLLSSPQYNPGIHFKLLFNELYTFGFNQNSIFQVLATLFPQQVVQSEPPKDLYKSTFVKRQQECLRTALEIALLNLPSSEIPSELGGAKASTRPNFVSLAESSTNQSVDNIPIIKAGQRKMRRWRKAADESTIESAEELQNLQEIAYQIVHKTGLVSEALIRPLTDACSNCPVLSYLTAITSMSRYVRGIPRLPNDLIQEKKLENFVKQIRQNEFKIIQASGFNIYSYTEGNNLELKPKVWFGLDMWIVDVTLFLSPNIDVQFLIHLQDPGDAEVMRSEQTELRKEVPLIVDQQMWKNNLQFKGTYPLVLPYVDLHCKQLSNYGKAVLLKNFYFFLSRVQYQKQPILQALLQLSDSSLLYSFKEYEKQLQSAFQASTLNTKKFTKEDMDSSFVMEIAKQLAKDKQHKKGYSKSMPLSPLLFAMSKQSENVQTIQSTFQSDKSNDFLFVEDKFLTIKDVDFSKKFLYIEPTIQVKINEYEYKEQNSRNSKQGLMSVDFVKKMLMQRNQQNYNSFLSHRQQLPVYQNADQLFELITNNDLVILTSQTGSGKSTNLPQIILEKTTEPIRIIVTQPRRISAISLSDRVVQESGLPNKTAIGYSVKGTSNYCETTLIQYCTIGVLLRKVISNVNELYNYSHILIDEVHERDISTDMFLSILKNHYQFVSPETKKQLPKIIIMSATIDGEKFACYFSQFKVGHFSLDGRMFNTTVHFLDELKNLGCIQKKAVAKKLQIYEDELYDGDVDSSEDLFVQDVNNDDIDDYKLNVPLIYQILKRKIYQDGAKGNVLIFLPGQYEINKCIEYLIQKFESNFEILPCHSMISLENQQSLFKFSSKNRIICATNIAEASITIPNIIAVIDTGTERQVVYHPRLRKHEFKTVFISQESATQRAGRAGRICDGDVYCCYLQQTYNAFNPHKTPEIICSSLSNCCMQLLLLSSQYLSQNQELSKLSQPHIFLQSLIDSPNKGAITSNLKMLIDHGFIGYECNDEGISQMSMEQILTSSKTKIFLTQFGAETAFLPIEPSYGRILFIAHTLGIDMTMAKQLVAIMSVGQNQIIKQLNVELRRLEQKSDHLLLLKLFREFLQKQNIKKYQINQQGLASAKDTLSELTDENLSKFSNDDLILALPLLQISFFPNVACLRRNWGYFVKQARMELAVHNSSLCKSDGNRLVFYNEQLTTGKTYLVTCSVGSALALLYSANDENIEIDFRRGVLRIFDAELAIDSYSAVILKRFVSVVRKFNIGLDLFKNYLKMEVQFLSSIQ